ncbi:hypothetical protein C361_02660 [Cryptococcus neoformans Tu259-1]|uniref:Uncharacterized protein n=1 Tax=Cryptococcus neoformans Tu259-1 TaxID=1230072 RepID=A0A854QN19_CRYNE|nr:hypothetical protein C361_02660 [Cryptococcus neoformans var. grubii Tu259-1]
MSFTPGHPANATYPSPLCYVPFDINQLYSVPNVVAINSLSEFPTLDAWRDGHCLREGRLWRLHLEGRII